MHAVIRSYSGSGASELFDLLEKRKSDVEDMMRSIEGFVAYDLVRRLRASWRLARRTPRSSLSHGPWKNSGGGRPRAR